VRRLLFATSNPGKRREVARILAGLDLELLFPADLGLDLDPEETGETFEENAALKARAFAAAAPGLWVAAEDSGLVIPALGGEPGVRSARYGGTRDDGAHNALVLARLAGRAGAERACHYRAVIVLRDPEGRETACEGRVDGVVAEAPRGTGGFGYDPLFFSPELGCTFGEARPADKDRLSHRGRALAALRGLLEAAP
jgi:XTP/dITP diphosphohydrolase